MEEVLYLQYNRDLWDERTVKHAIDDLNSERKAARAAAARTREVLLLRPQSLKKLRMKNCKHALISHITSEHFQFDI